VTSATIAGENGGHSNEHLGKRMGAREAHDVSLNLLRVSDGILGTVVWSISEEQFICSYRQGDQNNPAPAPPDPIEEATSVQDQRKARALARALESAESIPRADREAVITLRKAGMGYVAIEKEMGIEGKKGFWAWKIFKAYEREEADRGEAEVL
jgi:hypothetical protein